MSQTEQPQQQQPYQFPTTGWTYPQQPMQQQPPVPQRRRIPGTPTIWAIVAMAFVIVLLAGGLVAATGGAGSSAAPPEVEKYVAALADLDAQLDVGMTQSEYNVEVRDIASLKAKVDEDALDDDATEVMDLADEAYGVYSYIDTEWNDCITDDYSDSCTDGAVDLSGWDENHDLIEKAKDLLDA